MFPSKSAIINSVNNSCSRLDNVRNKEQEKIYKQFLNPDWLEKDIILQSCFLATARDNKNNEWKTIALADSGATITFVSQSLARKLNLQAVATWEGQINGINSSRKINANVYKIYIEVENKFVPILAPMISDVFHTGIHCSRTKLMQWRNFVP